METRTTRLSADGDDQVSERGVASMARARSLQSRLSGALAVLLCGGVGVGLLVWYYGTLLHARSAPVATRQSHAPAAMADSALPPLDLSHEPSSPTPAAASPVQPQVSLPTDPVLSAAPLLPAATATPPFATPQVPQNSAPDRRLAGPAFVGSSAPAPADLHDSIVTTDSGPLGALLTPTVMPTGRASELPTQRLLLAKGSFIDCTLETAIDSSLPGMTTCITATDTFSVDGKVVLLERGSKLIGETRGQVQQGAARLFVLWTEARTPTGVVVPLASPGTDALGRSGLDGEVDRHFWQRFGAAILISLVDAAAQVAQRSSTVIYDTSTSQNVATEALKGSIGLAPTITKNQGDRIQVLVARDLDFRQVYQLRETVAAHQQ
ncbi:MAG TPA: type IV secretion system protein VirB10 [Steroidobacteraceae bacterium]|nr:type IV secretion system protein VirB10 [Steroidobacteraceae bacterium]